MASSVGQIGLDLVVNQNGFNQQMNGITGLAKKAGIALAGAFAIKKLIDFGKSCIDLGSDLSEIQNVVDTAFPTMTGQIEKFSNAAIEQFGLSQTVAKKYASTFGAMAQSFGFSEKAAYDMSTALTGLAGDVASFYNISSDEAYTKLKSVFTGETETLKELGVVMTQSALDAYAMANGFGKTTKSMSEQEKVALRLAFVQDKLSMASGDFAKTSNSWANQTRILSLRWQEFKATIGQGLINVFTPILGVINKMLAGLSTLANGFKAFTELLTGNKSQAGSGVGKVATEAMTAQTGLEGAGDAANSLSNATDGVGKSAKKAAKDMGKLMGFDQLNILDKNDDSNSGESDSGAVGSDALNGANVDYGKLSEGENQAFSGLEKTIKKVVDRAKELADLFKTGFKIGLGDTDKVFSSIKNNLSSIKSSFLNIFSDGNVLGAFNRMVDSITFTFGEFIGSVGSIGLTITDNLIGGIAISLQEQAPNIKQWLIDMFDIRGSISQIIGKFFNVVSDICTVFRGPEAKQITADIISIFTMAFTNTLELTGKAIKDILDAIVSPIVNNKERIKTALENSLKTIQVFIDSVKECVTTVIKTVVKLYDEHISPLVDSIGNGISKIVKHILDFYNKYLSPFLQDIAKDIKILVNDNIKPIIEKVGEIIGKLVDLLKEYWEQVIVPNFNWIVDNILPGVIFIAKGVWETIKGVIDSITDIINGVLEVIDGVIDFIVGVFTGDWKKAWTGVKNIFKGIWDTFVGIVKTPVNAILKLINGLIDGINMCINGLNKFSFTAPDWLPPPLGGKSFGFSIPTIGSVPYLAKGGIVSAPTLAMVGESGKEAVVPLENNTEWMDKIGTVVANAVISAMQFSGSNNNNNKSGDIILQVDGTTFARVINPFCHKENDRMGTKMIIKPV